MCVVIAPLLLLRGRGTTRRPHRTVHVEALRARAVRRDLAHHATEAVVDVPPHGAGDIVAAVLHATRAALTALPTYAAASLATGHTEGELSDRGA